MQAEVKNKKVIVFRRTNNEDGLKGLASSQPPSPKAGKAVFRHSRHFLLIKLVCYYREGEENVSPRDVGTDVMLEHVGLTWSTLFLTRGNDV